MPSIFDYIFNRQAAGPPAPGQVGPLLPQTSSNDPRVPSMLDDSPSARDTLMGLSQGLLAAGQPSLMPMDFGAAVGKGLSGALGANDEDKRLKRALVKSQVMTAQDEIARQRAITKSILDASGPDPATPATAAPNALAPVLPGGSATPGKLPAEWDPHYQKASADTGLSVELLKAKDLVESGGNPNAVSPAGAGGPAQLMPGTAADLKVANRFDPAQAIPGGANYLKQMYDKYGKNPDIALMAYNWGPGNVDNWIRTGANPANVPAETKAYLTKIHANLGTASPTFAGAQPAPGAPPLGPIAQPPVQLASAPGGAPPQVAAPMPPQGDAAPAGGPQVAQASPAPAPSPIPMPPTTAAPVANTLRQVIQNLSPAERTLLANQKPDDVLKFLTNRAAPNHETVLDTVDGTVKFVNKTDPEIGRRYQPVKAAELAISMRQAAASESQARAREEANRIRGANEPLQPPATAGGAPTPTPGYAEQKGAVSGAEAAAKVPSYLLQHQGELVIKDIQNTQTVASAARSSNANLDRLNSLLEKVSTGKGTETINDIKATAKAAGFDLNAMGIPDDVGPVQAAKALLAKMTLDLGSSPDGGLKGSFSDKDVAFLKSGIPGLDTTPEGRKLIIDFQKRVNQRHIDVARIVNEYGRSPEFLKDPTGVYARVREYADANPLFDPEKDTVKAPGKSGSLPMPGAVRRFNPATGKLE